MTEPRQGRILLTLDVAGFIVSLNIEDPAMGMRIQDRYRDFLCTDRTAHLDISISVVRDALFIEPEPGPWIIETDFRDDRLVYRSYLERGEVDFTTGSGWLEVAAESNIENFLRVVYAWLCVNDDALLLHAAGVIRQDLGYVFFGPSGAGKTTTSNLAARSADVVSDDLVIIRLLDKKVTLHGVPFRGEMSDAPRANQYAALRAIFRLRQDTSHFIEPLPQITAVADLVASSPFIVRELSLSDMLMTVCSKIASNVPVMQLHFQRDDGFWKVIDEHFENVPKTASTNRGKGY